MSDLRILKDRKSDMEGKEPIHLSITHGFLVAIIKAHS